LLRCADGSYYVGSTRKSLEVRVQGHQIGAFDGYISARRPVMLVFHKDFQRIEDAIAAECKLKGWIRAKKEAFIAGDFSLIQELAKRRTKKRRLV
jgi:putative endonuclease